MGGDGDITAIGGNHFIHACRRNMDLTVIIFNNDIYGMTGGQYSPTTPTGKIASTSPYGNVETPFNLVELAITSGATYVARSTVFHYAQTVALMRKALKHTGMSVVEVVTNCHTYYGRYNGTSSPQTMLQQFKDNTIPLSRAQKMESSELEGKIIVGEFLNIEKPTYTERYEELKENLMAKNEKE